MINVNEYFDGQVKSLGYTTGAGKSTVGVIAPGTYEFSTAQPEIMHVLEGALNAQLPGAEASQTFAAGSKFEVPGNAVFTVTATTPTAYLCQYR